MTKKSKSPSQLEDVKEKVQEDEEGQIDQNMEANQRISSYKSMDLMKKPVILKYNAYKRILIYASRYASEDINERDWREVYGILIGSIEEDTKKVIIKDAIPMVVGDRAGVKYENKQYVDMAQIDASVHERSIRDKKNDFIIGWWHTHPGFPFQFSNIDHQTQLGYQIPNPLAIGLIFNHCKLRSLDFFLGIAALRLMDPERGMWSPYDYIKIETEDNHKTILKKAEKRLKNVRKTLPKILKSIRYVDNVLRRKKLAQLQRNFGLILVPKKDIVITDNELDAEEDDKYLYEWDPEFYKKSFRIPRYRAKLEREIKKLESNLIELLQEKQIKKFEHKKQKYQRKVQKYLSKPNEWYSKMMKDYAKIIEQIYPYYDYFDTNERKVLEHFESRSSEYYKILESLNRRASFNVKQKLEN